MSVKYGSIGGGTMCTYIYIYIYLYIYLYTSISIYSGLTQLPSGWLLDLLHFGKPEAGPVWAVEQLRRPFPAVCPGSKPKRTPAKEARLAQEFGRDLRYL